MSGSHDLRLHRAPRCRGGRRRPGRPGDRLPARPAGPPVRDPRRRPRRGGRGGIRSCSSRPCATTASPGARSPATRTRIRDATTSSAISRTTRATSSCRSSSTAPSEHGDGGYVVELDDRTYEADQVVIATGPFQVRACPTSPVAWTRPSSRCTATRTNARGRPGARRRRRQHGLSDHRGALPVPRRAPLDRLSEAPLPNASSGRDLFRYLDAASLMDKTTSSRIGQRMQHRET